VARLCGVRHTRCGSRSRWAELAPGGLHEHRELDSATSTRAWRKVDDQVQGRPEYDGTVWSKTCGGVDGCSGSIRVEDLATGEDEGHLEATVPEDPGNRSADRSRRIRGCGRAAQVVRLRGRGRSAHCHKQRAWYGANACRVHGDDYGDGAISGPRLLLNERLLEDLCCPPSPLHCGTVTWPEGQRLAVHLNGYFVLPE